MSSTPSQATQTGPSQDQEPRVDNAVSQLRHTRSIGIYAQTVANLTRLLFSVILSEGEDGATLSWEAHP